MQSSQGAPTSFEEAKRKADAEMRRFYEGLEGLLKRHQPIDFAPYVSALLRMGRTNIQQRIWTPPHKVLHAVEANCAYARGHNRDPVTWNRIARVMNTYHANEGAWLQDVIGQGKLQYFMLLMYREQLELQYEPFKNDVARPWALFTSDRATKLAAEFEAAFGLSVQAWLHICFAAHVAAERNASGAFLWSQVRRAEFLRVSPQAYDGFLRSSALTPSEIGARFRESRATTPPFLHVCIRSVFLDYPLIDFGNDQLLAPEPALLFRHAGQGLYRLARELPSFDRDFGRSFENYIGDLLRSLTVKATVSDSTHVERLSAGKSCDYIVETDTYVMLVECKACSFVSRLLTEQSLSGDGSCAKVGKAIQQLHATAHDLGTPAFAKLGIDAAKPAFGIVVTYGDIPFANSDWYFESFFVPRFAEKLKPPVYPSERMVWRPAVMSVGTFELLIALINATGCSPVDLAQERSDQKYARTGDWSPYLQDKLRLVQDEVAPLDGVERAMAGFFASLGLVRGKDGTYEKSQRGTETLPTS